ncbi:hypothetical protein [Brevundimonas sp.]|uniref:hypothetical protein n=1 Tax=Brevundimonas sp. TaxID=1871086 RepID=UPI002737AFAF|nr:hypothetical protein [Brevundimonas sp.]MDP3801134.1 hypothetical protein [Brevundimonas sp.]
MRRFGAVLLGGLWGLAASATAQEIAYAPTPPPPPGSSTCPGGICQPEALSGLFEALAAAGAGGREHPVHVLQIGDSHTAGDGLTGKLRADLQARFGSGGRGALPAGPPYPGYAPFHVELAAEGWSTEVAPLHALRRRNAGFGLASVRGRAGPGQLEFRLEPGSEVRQVGVCGWPRGGGDGVIIDPGNDEPWPINLNPTSDDGSACITFPLARPASSIRISGVGSGATIASVWLEGDPSGVVVSGLGLTGATLRDLASRSDDLVSGELAIWKTTLLVLAFGTNEGFDPDLDPVAYERLLRDQIERMRRLGPFDMSLMILGAPDALRNGAVDGCSVDGQRAPPPSLALVRDVQRRVAADMGVAFWDWHGRMGGDCSADRLASMADPLMRPDRVHFTGAGAGWIGGVLSADLLAAYDAWKADAGPATGGVD